MKKIAYPAVLGLFAALTASAQISVPSAGTVYTQDFNTLASDSSVSVNDFTTSAWAQNSTLPGWFLFTKSGSPTAVATYNSKDGNAKVGSFWSYGSAGTTDRALGSQLQNNAAFYDVAYADVATPGTDVGYIAVSFTNNSGSALGGVTLSYTGEQWRESNVGTANIIRVDYGFGTTFADVTSWTAAGDSFAFTTPLFGTTAALNGNTAANRVAGLGGTIQANWQPGTTLWIRWVEVNDSGIDHGWAIDDVSVTANANTSGVAPAITQQPTTQAANAGDTVTLSVAASGTPTPTYQWSKDGTPIAGATSASLVITPAATTDSGSYTVAVTNSAGTVTSSAAVLTVNAAPANPGRLINVSVRAQAGIGDQTLIAGFVITGSGTKPLLLRAAGPAIAQYVSSPTLADPQLGVYDVNATQIAANDNADSAAIALFSSLGAFPFPAGSADSAYTSSTLFTSGLYTAKVVDKNGGSGLALVEVYDAAPSTVGATLVNISTRCQVSTGDKVLTAGFVIGGGTPLRVLIRAVGPTLSNYNVSGVLADPQVTLYRSVNGVTSTVGSNDNWSANPDTSVGDFNAVFSSTGAFALTANSKDAAMLVTLPPGVYSAVVTGVGDTSGVALIEVYAAP